MDFIRGNYKGHTSTSQHSFCYFLHELTTMRGEFWDCSTPHTRPYISTLLPGWLCETWTVISFFYYYNFGLVRNYFLMLKWSRQVWFYISCENILVKFQRKERQYLFSEQKCQFCSSYQVHSYITGWFVNI